MICLRSYYIAGQQWLRQSDLCEFQASLGYKSQFQDRLQSYGETLCQKKIKKRKKTQKTKRIKRVTSRTSRTVTQRNHVSKSQNNYRRYFIIFVKFQVQYLHQLLSPRVLMGSVPYSCLTEGKYTNMQATFRIIIIQHVTRFQQKKRCLSYSRLEVGEVQYHSS